MNATILDNTLNSTRNCKINLMAETNLLMFLTVLENIVALCVLLTVRVKSHNHTHLLITMMATSDMVAAVGILISVIISAITCQDYAVDAGIDVTANWVPASLACASLGWVTMTAFCWSLHIVCVMNIERYLMVCHPIFHRNHCSSARGIVLAAGLGVLAISILIGLPLIGVGMPYVFYSDNNICAFDLVPRGNGVHRALLSCCSCQGITYVLLTALSNIAVSRKLSRKVSPILLEESSEETNNKKWRTMGFIKHIIRWKKSSGTKGKTSTYSFVTKVVAAVNCIMNLPFYVKILVHVGQNSDNLDSIMDTITTVLWFATGFVNPIIYIACNKIYRHQLLKPFKRLCPCCSKDKVQEIKEPTTRF